MTTDLKFEIGDLVRVKRRAPVGVEYAKFKGLPGMVIETDESQLFYPYVVDFGTGVGGYFDEHEIEAI